MARHASQRRPVRSELLLSYSIIIVRNLINSYIYYIFNISLILIEYYQLYMGEMSYVSGLAAGHVARVRLYQGRPSRRGQDTGSSRFYLWFFLLSLITSIDIFLLQLLSRVIL